MPLPRLVRFADLADLDIVKNRPQLRNLVKHQGFPPGRLAGPNTRVWSEDEILAWLESRRRPLSGTDRSDIAV
jgi:predicted DNA-binding transcriptional regulator AlpA